jgi:hypothetical protein
MALYGNQELKLALINESPTILNIAIAFDGDRELKLSK